MDYGKEQYEQLIRESILFDLDPEKERTVYKRESLRMIGHLYGYLMSVSKEKYEPYGCEIMELAGRCMKSFDPSKGIFLHYFNAAWKKEYSHIMRDKIHEERLRGIHISEEEKRMVQRFLRLSSNQVTAVSSDELYQKIADAFGIKLEKVRRIAELSSLSVSGERFDADQEFSLWEVIPDPFSFEMELEEAATLEEWLNQIEQVFYRLQERQKPMISDLLTIRICSVIDSGMVDRYQFLSSDVMQRWIKEKTVPSQKEIALKYGRSEASISRTIQRFLTQLRDEIK